MLITPPFPIGAELSSKLVPLPSRSLQILLFYQFFWKWSLDDAKKISFQGIRYISQNLPKSLGFLQFTTYHPKKRYNSKPINLLICFP